MNSQTDKATARPWIAGDIAIWSKCGTQVLPYPDYINEHLLERTEANAALIVLAVNQFDALTAVAEAANRCTNTVIDSPAYFTAKRDLIDRLAELDRVRKDQV